MFAVGHAGTLESLNKTQVITATVNAECLRHSDRYNVGYIHIPACTMYYQSSAHARYTSMQLTGATSLESHVAVERMVEVSATKWAALWRLQTSVQTAYFQFHAQRLAVAVTVRPP